MYYIPKSKTVRVAPGRSVCLSAGPRGVKDGVDYDAKVREALGDTLFKALLKDGTIEEREGA